MKALDFNYLKKVTWQVTLNDKEKTKLFLKSPTKALVDRFKVIQSMSVEGSESDSALDEIYEIVAELLSLNTRGIKITVKKVEESFDFEDLKIFMTQYGQFMREITSSKN